ncbi:MAG: hypothetical protein R3281_11510 [Balneolaceae bacterium]|nr:hypothetical protein [Balneolaceae bacterium]
MKKCQFLKYGLFLWLGISLIACEYNSLVTDSSNTESTIESETGKVYGRHSGKVATPFKADFFTVLNEEEVAANPNACDTPPFTAYNVQEGSGEATHLGKFTVLITFCGDISELLPGDDSPGVLEPGETIPYNNGMGSFVASNGDKLFFTISGEVLPSDHPDYNFEFRDPFTFTGGTGRFSGANGHGITDSFVELSTDRTDHIWTGTLILAPGY